MKKGRKEGRKEGMDELLPFGATSSLSDIVPEAPLLSATSSLSSILSGLLL